MIKLILIRHAATNANEKGKLSGIGNCDLSETGKKQVQKLTNYLKNLNFNKIYTSCSSRAQETISLISYKKGIDLDIRSNLNELDFGDFDGWTFKEIEKKFPEEYNKLLKDGDNYRFPRGESLIESYYRVSQEVDLIINENMIKLNLESKELHNEDLLSDSVKSKIQYSKNIVICSHAGTIRNIVSYLISSDYKKHWNYKIDNSSVTIIEIDNGFPVLTMLNNTEFLK